MRKRKIRDAREMSKDKPVTVTLKSKYTPPDPANGTKSLAPFESLAEAEALLKQYEPMELHQTRDPVFEATTNSLPSREEWTRYFPRPVSTPALEGVCCTQSVHC